MNAFASINDSIRSILLRGGNLAKRRIVGANNERLDFIMDSFYKLSPSQQSGVLVGIFGGIGILVLGFFALYLSQINALERNLNDSFASLHRMRSLLQQYQIEDKKFSELKNIVSRGSAGFRPKPFFESEAGKAGITITDLRSREENIPVDNPLSRQFSYSTIEFKLPKVSIPRLLKFLTEIEKSRKNLNINSLLIRTRYGDRLYFETSAKVVSYKLGGQS